MNHKVIRHLSNKLKKVSLLNTRKDCYDDLSTFQLSILQEVARPSILGTRPFRKKDVAFFN